MRIVSFTLTFCFCASLFGQGISFFEGSFDEAKELAAKEAAVEFKKQLEAAGSSHGGFKSSRNRARHRRGNKGTSKAKMAGGAAAGGAAARGAAGGGSDDSNGVSRKDGVAQAVFSFEVGGAQASERSSASAASSEGFHFPASEGSSVAATPPAGFSFPATAAGAKITSSNAFEFGTPAASSASAVAEGDGGEARGEKKTSSPPTFEFGSASSGTTGTSFEFGTASAAGGDTPFSFGTDATSK